MLVPFLLLSTATLASANSRGVGVPCNVDVAVGSDDVMTESAANMWWAKRATWAGSQYTLRTGDGDVAADATSYTPNAWTEIYLRSNEQYKQFTGLVLYAEDSSGNKVGQWSIPAKAPFHKPGDCVVHNNANQKNYLNTFRFSVPRGTGKVTIKALVKYGLANPVKDGAFFWPNNAHLTLTEGTALTDQTWFEGQPGESCDTVCASAGGKCDLDTMLSGAIGPSLYDAVKTTTTCTLPLMAGCSGASPSVTDEGCFFHDATCEPPAAEPIVDRGCTQYCSTASQPHVMGDCCKFSPDRWPPEDRNRCSCVTAAQTYSEHEDGAWEDGTQPGDTMAPTPPPPEKEQLTCGATIEWNRLARRICACSGARVVAPCSPDEELCSPGLTSSATTQQPWANVVAITLTSLLLTLSPSSSSSSSTSSPSSSRRSRGSSSSVLWLGAFLLALATLPTATAHNWLTSPARGNEAGENNGFNGFTSPPCPQKTARIHAQVGPGQRFPIEWAAGHGFGSFTYFAVMKASDEKEMAKHSLELFDEYLEEAPSTDYLSEFPVHHVSHNKNTNSYLADTDVSDSYVWAPGDATQNGVRPAGFRDFGASPVVTPKTEAGREADKRAQYTNPKYPWLISVHKFTMRYDFPEDADTTQLEIPAEFGSGKYVVQYWWSGYYDCIDINVLDVPSTDIWGSGGGTTGFDRVDHCEFIDYSGYSVVSECRGLTDSGTVGDCACDTNQGCQGIQVVQTQLDPRVTDAGVWSAPALPASCDAVKESPFVCFGISMGEPKVGPNYRISGDPEDPVFYNSCFKAAVGWTFQQVCNSCPPTSLAPGWLFNQHCISCNDMRTNARQSGFIPKWAFAEADQCRHCDNQG